MTAKYIQRGETVDYKNTGSTKITAGSVVSLVSRVGIVGGDIEAGATGALHLLGVFEVAKATGAISVGDALYYDESEDEFTKTVSGNIPAGWAVAAATSDAATVNICICGIPATAGASIPTVSAADATFTADTVPTAAQFAAVVALANANKAAINAVIASL